jgi:3-dehydroquinate dehydratase-2
VIDVLVLQGPNLNLLGEREPEIYGRETLHQLHARIAEHARRLGLSVDFFQSNHEGALIDRLHQRDFRAVVVNAGGLTHTSVSLRDALLAIRRPFVEVHLSDPWKREAFRRVNYLHDVALASVVGKGGDGYLEALDLLAAYLAGEVGNGETQRNEGVTGTDDGPAETGAGADG